MTRLFALIALTISLAMTSTSLEAAPFSVPADLLVRGDHSDKEILRYRRIRIERQEVLYDDTQPMICRVGSTVLVAGHKGSLAMVVFIGRVWAMSWSQDR